ncbi:MAG: hypothetical protein ACYTFG_00285 [Planctomycetota bacterium]|jgi:hypothetical protein
MMLLAAFVIGPQVNHNLRSRPYVSTSGTLVWDEENEERVVASCTYSYSGVRHADALVIGLEVSSRSGIAGRGGRRFGRLSYSKAAP